MNAPGHIAWFLLLVPIGFVARIFIEALVGEALGMLLGRLLPPWMKTRRALWTGVAVMCLITLAAVAYWNLAGRASPRPHWLSQTFTSVSRAATSAGISSTDVFQTTSSSTSM